MAKSEFYFPLFYRRLLVSTTGWKDEEFGAYMRLLIHQFDNNNRISPDLEDLKRIAPSIKKNWPLISKKFKADENGMLYNQVMSEIFEDINGKRLENKKNGLLGGRPKKENQTVIEEKPNGLPNGYENKTHTKDKDITKEKEIKKERNKESLFADLDEVEIRNSIEYLHRTIQKRFSENEIKNFFEAFKIRNADEFYHSRGKVVNHLRDWIKKQDTPINGKHQEVVPGKRFKF